MRREIQGLADGLHMRVGIPVTIEDVHHRLLAYSAAPVPADNVHAATILNQRVPTNAARWFRTLGIRTHRDPIRIPANPRIGSVERLCVPAWCEDQLYGFVWLIGEETRVPGAHEAIALNSATAVAEALHTQRAADATDRGRERELVRDLLSQHIELRRHAADELVDGNFVIAARAAAVLVVRPFGPRRVPMRAVTRASMEVALESARRMSPPGRSLYLVHPDHAVFVIVTENDQFQPRTMDILSERILEAVARHHSDGVIDMLVGVGDIQPGLMQLTTSYDEALRAVRVAEVIPKLRPVATWSKLGIYRILLQLPTDERVTTLLHPGLLSLFAQDANGSLTETLEAYLDLAADAQRTRTYLQLHRASLYYRLHRIERLAKVDLGDGEDRLALHLSIKLARLANLIPSRSARASSDLRGKQVAPNRRSKPRVVRGQIVQLPVDTPEAQGK